MDQKNTHRKESQCEINVGDQDLITRCQQGEIAAFKLLIQHYQDHVYTYVYENVGDKAIVPNIVRAIFVRAYKTLPRFHGKISVKAWLLKLAEHQLQHHAAEKCSAWLTRFFSTRGMHRGQTPKEPEPDANEPQGECQKIRALFLAYLEGELCDADAQLITAHLRECTDCSKDFDQLVDTIELLETAGTLQTPAELHALILADIERLQQSFWQRAFQRLPLSAPQLAMFTASVALLCVIIVLYQNVQLRRQLDQYAQPAGHSSRFSFDSVRTSKDTFVILTGSALAADSLKDVQALADILRVSPQRIKRIAINGDFETVSQMVIAKIPMLEGNIRENTIEQKPPLIIRRIIADVPEGFSEILTSFLHHSEPAGSAQPPIAAIPVRIFIITQP